MVDSLEKSASASAMMMTGGSAPGSPTKGASSGRYSHLLAGVEVDEEEGTASSLASASSLALASSEGVGVGGNSRMSGMKHGHEHSARGLPHRGSVSDLFGGGGGGGSAAAADDAGLVVQEKEARDGGSGGVRRNGNAREPRLLPFPPGMSFASLSLSFRVYGMFMCIFLFYLFQRHITSRPRNIIIRKGMDWGC